MKQLKLENVSKRYTRKKVLDKINLEINKGEIIAVLGLNGSGKTTLLKIMSGILNPSNGTVSYGGNPIKEVNHMREIMFVPDKIVIPTYLKVYEVAKMFQEQNPKYNQEYLEKYLEKLGIDINSKISTLSKGNKELVQLGILLSNIPEMIILDEPLGAVDVVKREIILDLLIDLQMDGVTIVLSTHLINDIESIMSQVIILKDKRIILEKSVESLQAEGKSIQEVLIDYTAK